MGNIFGTETIYYFEYTTTTTTATQPFQTRTLFYQQVHPYQFDTSPSIGNYSTRKDIREGNIGDVGLPGLTKEDYDKLFKGNKGNVGLPGIDSYGINQKSEQAIDQAIVV